MPGIERPLSEVHRVELTPSATDPPTDRAIHLWSVSLDRDQSPPSAWRELLSQAEQQRAEQFHFATDRHRFLTRRGVLRTILAGYLRADPAKLQFRTGPQGKPHLAGDFACHRLEFSLAQSRGQALVAVAVGQRIGVDLEGVRPLSDFEGLIQYCLTRSERSVLEDLSFADQLLYFYQSWTGKEACLKVSGEGLTRALDSIRISWCTLNGEGSAEVQHDSEASEEWFVQSFSPCDGYLASIACPQRPTRFECFTI